MNLPNTLPRYRVELVREDSTSACAPVPLSDPAAVVAAVSPHIQGIDRSVILALFADAKLHAIGMNVVSIGTLNDAYVHPREVLKPAILANASSIIVVCALPYDGPEPSEQMIQMAQELSWVCRAMDIPLRDFVFIDCDGAYFSMWEAELLGVKEDTDD